MQSPAPSEYFEGIKFNYSFYTTGDTKVTLEYVNNNFLKCVGYAYSRAISTSFNGIIYVLGGIEGSGAGLTNLKASNISTGILNEARIPTLAIGKISGLQGSLDAKQATLIPGNGITISVNNTINCLWQNPITFVNFDSVHTTRRVRIGALPEAEAFLQLTGNSTNGIASKNLATGYSDRLIIAGSGNVGIATTPDLTYRLTVGGAIKATDTISTLNGLTSSNGVGTDYVVITRPLTAVGSNTLLTLINDNGNGLRVQQNYIVVNDYKYSIFQKDNEVEYATPNITFYKGKIGIGTTTPATYPLTVGGDVNISGNYRVNGALYKPTASGNDDTETKLATARYVGGVLFYGSADINMDYFSLNNKPITLLPTTTNFQVGTSYNLILGSVATTPIERLHAGGNIRTTGNITVDTNLTVTGTSTHTGTSTLTGRVGIAKAPHATYSLDVLGDINVSGVFRVGGVVLTSWSTSGTSIYYNGGNLGIGNTNPLGTLHLGDASQANNDGRIIFAKYTTVGSTRI
jgi:hypothetical protein